MNTDKLVEALVLVYRKLQIEIEFLIFDGDRHNTSTHILPLYKIIKKYQSSYIRKLNLHELCKNNF